MENCPSNDMVDHMDGQNSTCFESMSSPLHRIKMNCIITFCYWYSSEYIDDPVVIIDISGSL